MTETETSQNSKAVVVRIFYGYLLVYYVLIYLSLMCSGLLIDAIAPFLGYSDVDVGRRLFNFPGALFGLFVIAGIPIFYIGALLFILLFLYCFAIKRRFFCSPSKISFFHCFILFSSVIILLITYLFGIQGENGDYFGLPFVFANVSVITFLIAITLKSTFRKRIFMKKE